MRRVVALLPFLTWTIAALVGLGFGVRLPTQSQSVSSLALAFCFAALGIWCVRPGIKEFREAMAAPLEPLFTARRPVRVPVLPLTEDERLFIRDALARFEATGLLEPREVTFAQVLAHSEHDDEQPTQLVRVARELRVHLRPRSLARSAAKPR